MNNMVHKTANLQERKHIEVAKNPLYKPAETPTPTPTPETPTPTPETSTPVALKEDYQIIPSLEDNKPDLRAQKREEFSALEKARKLAQQAKKEREQAEQLATAYQSKDLSKIAKAYDMSVSDYVRWVNTQALSAPTNKELTPEQVIAQNALKWKENTDKELAELRAKAQLVDKERNENTKATYINKNILPYLIKDPDKFEFIHDRGAEQVCNLVYDFMNSHYNETGGPGQGEELDPIPLLEELEQQYFQEWQEEEKLRTEKKGKLKKLQAQNQPAKDEQPKNDQPVKTIAPAKSNPHPMRTQDDLLANTLSNDEEDSLAQSAPSNLTSGPTHGLTPAKSVKRSQVPGFTTGGVTPKSSKFSRESRLKELEKNR